MPSSESPWKSLNAIFYFSSTCHAWMHQRKAYILYLISLILNITQENQHSLDASSSGSYLSIINGGKCIWSIVDSICTNINIASFAQDVLDYTIIKHPPPSPSQCCHMDYKISLASHNGFLLHNNIVCAPNDPYHRRVLELSWCTRW